MRDSGSHGPTAVMGGTGKIGRRVVGCCGSEACRCASSRAPGARSVYLVYLPDLGSRAAAPRLREVSELAVSPGAERLVFQSGRGWPEAVPAEEAAGGAGAAR